MVASTNEKALQLLTQRVTHMVLESGGAEKPDWQDGEIQIDPVLLYSIARVVGQNHK